MRPWFYPRDGSRVFWQPFAAPIVGIDWTDEYLKSLRVARVCAQGCRGVSYRLSSRLRQITPDVGRKSARTGSDEHTAQERSNGANFVRVDRVLHRVLVPLDGVAECLQSVARRRAAHQRDHLVTRSVRHEDRNASTDRRRFRLSAA